MECETLNKISLISTSKRDTASAFKMGCLSETSLGQLPLPHSLFHLGNLCIWADRTFTCLFSPQALYSMSCLMTAPTSSLTTTLKSWSYPSWWAVPRKGSESATSSCWRMRILWTGMKTTPLPWGRNIPKVGAPCTVYMFSAGNMPPRVAAQSYTHRDPMWLSLLSWQWAHSPGWSRLTFMLLMWHYYSSHFCPWCLILWQYTGDTEAINRWCHSSFHLFHS